MFWNVSFKARQFVAPKFVFALLGNGLILAAGRPTFAVPTAGPEPLTGVHVVCP
jgi:hypothetical protein